MSWLDKIGLCLLSIGLGFVVGFFIGAMYLFSGMNAEMQACKSYVEALEGILGEEDKLDWRGW